MIKVGDYIELKVKEYFFLVYEEILINTVKGKIEKIRFSVNNPNDIIIHINGGSYCIKDLTIRKLNFIEIIFYKLRNPKVMGGAKI